MKITNDNDISWPAALAALHLLAAVAVGIAACVCMDWFLIALAGIVVVAGLGWLWLAGRE